MADPPTRLRPPVDARGDHFRGPPDAPVTLVEYGDYQCPYCYRAHAGIKRAREERLGEQLRYVCEMKRVNRPSRSKPNIARMTPVSMTKRNSAWSHWFAG
jgi:hypothetical protein